MILSVSGDIDTSSGRIKSHSLDEMLNQMEFDAIKFVQLKCDTRRNMTGSIQHKPILIFLLAVVAPHFVSSTDLDHEALENADYELQNKDSKFEEVFKYVISTCKIKEKATDAEIENVVNNFVPSTTTEKCFIACWLESFQVIKNRRFCRDQYIQLSTYGQNMNENTTKALQQILQGCKLRDTCKQDRCVIKVYNEVYLRWRDEDEYRSKNSVKIRKPPDCHRIATLCKQKTDQTS